MKILQPHKISSEILDVVFNAKNYLIIVSPYVDLNHWQRLEAELLNAKKRGVRIDFFVRNDPNNHKSWQQVENLGIVPRLVDNLHAKFYFNEHSGVISSMNLLSHSQSNSIEIGCKLESESELEDLKRFVKDFIKPHEVNEKPSEDDLYVSKEQFTLVLEGFLQHHIDPKTKVYFKNGGLTIYALSNTFSMGMDKGNNKISIAAVVSSKEAEAFASKVSAFFQSSYFHYQLLPGGNGYYDMIGASTTTIFSQSYFDGLRINEKKQLIGEVANFIFCTKEFKKDCY